MGKILFALAGIGLGAAILQDPAGWLVGGLLGFLLGHGADLSRRLQVLEKDLQRLSRAPAERATSSHQSEPGVGPRSPEQAPAETSGPVKPAQRRSAIPATRSARRESPSPAASFGMVAKLVARIRHFFTRGNPVVRVGMVVMFFGLGFLVKYASGADLLPVELRLALIGAVAVGLMIIGWKTRRRHNGYGLILQGGGIAALYLTIFAANKFYTLMPATAAFGFMFVVVMLGAALAVLQNAQVLALMASAGGFLAPILTSDGSGNHIGLFSFYLFLNLGVLTMAWFKTWRLLNWTGFVLTFVITSAWGVLSYEPHLYSSTQPFLIAFFALYLAVSVLFSLKQPPRLAGLVDGTLVFGLPVVGFGLQAALLKHTEYGLAVSALILSSIYIVLATMLWRRHRTIRLLSESFISLGVVFATLAVPLALDADWTSATWAIEAAGLVWVGARQQRWLPRVAGYGLYLLGAGSLLVNGLSTGPVAVISGDFIGLCILAIAAFVVARVLHRNAAEISLLEGSMEWMVLATGLAWWILAGTVELLAHLPDRWHFSAVLFFFSFSILTLMVSGGRWRWPGLVRTGYSLLPLAALWLVGSGLWSLLDSTTFHPFGGAGSLALITLAAVQYRFLWHQRHSEKPRLVAVWHVLTVWTLLATLYWEALWWQEEMNWQGTASLVLWFICFSAPLVALLFAVNRSRWPFGQYRSAYRDAMPIPLIFGLFLWFAGASTNAGATWQVHVPGVNPLDLAQLAAVLLLAYLIRHNIANLGQGEAGFTFGAPALAGFLWVNLVALRAVHHHGGVDYQWVALWQSATVQMALSILWTLCALVIMNLSRRRNSRKLWLLGAGLLGAVVLKLFTKDLTGSGSLARTVSFLVVGALMLLIGYLSPIPGRAESAHDHKGAREGTGG